MRIRIDRGIIFPKQIPLYYRVAFMIHAPSLAVGDVNSDYLWMPYYSALKTRKGRKARLPIRVITCRVELRGQQ